MLSQQEKEKAIELLTQTENGVFDAIKDLTEAQINYKPAADEWTAAECIKHIAAAEKELWALDEAAITQAPNPEKRTEIKLNDDDLIRAVEDRSHKSKTFAALEPSNSPYTTVAEALAAFKAGREKLIAFVRSTNMDLRNHIVVLPIGTYDSYQFILLIAAHSSRHTRQLQEIMTNVNFPR